MSIDNFHVISIGTDQGDQELTISAPGWIAIPTMSSGIAPKFLHISIHSGTVTNVITVTPDIDENNGSNLTGFALCQNGFAAVILNVHGFSHIGFDEIGDGTSGLQLYPLEDF
jgi:hypothetical protein